MGLFRSIKRAVKKVAKVALPVAGVAGLGYLGGSALGLFGSSAASSAAAGAASGASALSKALTAPSPTLSGGQNTSALDWAQLGLAGVNSASSLFQASRSENFAQQNLAQQQAWNEYAAKHAHQWEMEDLKNAGLNPILSGTGGSGASVHSVTPQMPELSGYGNAVTNAFNILSGYNQLKQQAATIDNLRTTNNLLKSQVSETDSKTLYNYANAIATATQGSHTAKDIDRINEVIKQIQIENAKRGTFKTGYLMSELFGKGLIGNALSLGGVLADGTIAHVGKARRYLPKLINLFPTKGKYVP